MIPPRCHPLMPFVLCSSSLPVISYVYLQVVVHPTIIIILLPNCCRLLLKLGEFLHILVLWAFLQDSRNLCWNAVLSWTQTAASIWPGTESSNGEATSDARRLLLSETISTGYKHIHHKGNCHHCSSSVLQANPELIPRFWTWNRWIPNSRYIKALILVTTKQEIGKISSK